jgi:hypothetical protein
VSGNPAWQTDTITKWWAERSEAKVEKADDAA